MRYFFVLTLLRDHFDLFNSILTDSISDMTEDTEEGLKIIDKFYDWFENDYNTNVRDLPTGNKNEALFAFNDESTSNNVMENLMENISFTFK